MNNEVAKIEQKKEMSVPRQFRDMATKNANSLLVDWVGEDRAKAASARIAVALSQAAQCSRKPEEFYNCTPASVGAVIAVAALTNIMPSSGPTSLAYAIPRRARREDQKPNLTYQLSHRGLNALAQRSNMTMLAVPIGYNDDIQITRDGDVEIRNIDFDDPPTTEEELRGIVLVVKQISTGHTISRGWVPKKLINQRRDESDSYQFALKESWAQSSDPWHIHYVPMAMKTAMHYGVARGWCVIDDTEAIRAMDMDIQPVIDESEVVKPVETRRTLAQVTEILVDGKNDPIKVEPVVSESSAKTIAADKFVSTTSEVSEKPVVADAVEKKPEKDSAEESTSVSGDKNPNMALFAKVKKELADCDAVLECKKIAAKYIEMIKGDGQDAFVYKEAINAETDDRCAEIRKSRGK